MGASPSKVSEALTGEKPAEKDKSNPKVVQEALTKNNQTVIEKEVRDKIAQVSEVFTQFNNNDDKALLAHIDGINKELKANKQDEIVISDNIKGALVKFRDAILKSITDDTMSDETKKEKYKELMAKDDPKTVIEALKKTIAIEMEEKKQKILGENPITKDAAMTQDINTILGNVKDLKVKYKYFEYKYIEMNLFLIIFIQKVYTSMDTFVANVLSFNNARDVVRDEMLRDTLKLMTSILDASDLQITDEDSKALSSLMTQTKNRAEEKQKELEEYLKTVVKSEGDGLKELLSTFSDALKLKMFDTLKENAAVKAKQSGGFVRGESVMPQAFYELDAVP